MVLPRLPLTSCTLVAAPVCAVGALARITLVPIAKTGARPTANTPAAAISRPVGACEPAVTTASMLRSEEHTSELQSRGHLVCRLLLEKKKTIDKTSYSK